MKNFAPLAVLLLAVIAGVAQKEPSVPSGQDQATNRKVIKDPGEYNAYVTALNMENPTQKAAAMEAFMKQYPQSVVFTDALNQAMAAYQQAGDQAKVADAARRIVQLIPTHIRALAVLVALDRSQASAPGGNPTALKEGCADAQAGLQQLPTSQKPDGLTDADFEKLKQQMADIFNGASGFCALQNKDYASARAFLQKAFNPADFQNTYQLAVADLEANPLDVNGFWYGEKAMGLAAGDPATLDTVSKYVKAWYKKYHGKVDDWDKFAAMAAAQTSPPADIAALIPPAPTPCDLAVNVLKENKPEELSFSDKEFILAKANCSPANKEAADKVWQSIQDMEKGGQARLEIPVKVIAISKKTMDAAISEDNQAAGKADLHVELEKPLLKPPLPGAMIKVIGVIAKYTPDPFLFTMEKGALPGKARTATRKHTGHSKGAQKSAG